MERPNPDELLAKIKSEDTHRGKLKIFFGAVAGVGKTYSMLEAARHGLKEGVDAVVGYVETHKREETEALLEGFEIIPPKKISYKNVELNEFDIDSALKRKPQLMLVDELAHTNAAGSRHAKRWQDIEELLDAGIDVYTTLNVQHCESVNDIVTQVTGIVVRETVPDTMLEKADEIELVDLPTEELLKRLKDGKVYLGEQAERAREHFFQPGNLIALRQLALRYTERNVDSKLMYYRKTHSISKVWGVKDSFLICISPNPGAINLIRSGKRITAELGVEWVVANVETSERMHEDDKNRISEMLRFAEKLGAEVVTLSGPDVADTLIAYARARNITKIVVGKPSKPRLKERVFGTVIDALARKCGEIDLYLLSGDKQEEQTFTAAQAPQRSFDWRHFIFTIGIIALCTIIGKGIFSHLGLVNLIMIYLFGVTWVASQYGRRMAIIASFLSVLVFDFFFVPPLLSFNIADVEYIITFFAMLTVGLTIAHVTGLLRQRTSTMQQREYRTHALYAISRDLAKSSYPEELIKIAYKHIKDFFKCPVIIFVPDKNKKLAVQLTQDTENYLTESEYAVAQWVYEHKKTAGKGTDTLPGSNGIYLPLLATEKTIGVFGLFPGNDKQFLDPEQYHMLEMFVSQTALAVEGAQLAAAALEAEAAVENERLKDVLLTTFSADISGSLVSISKSVAELAKNEYRDNEKKRTAVIQEISRDVKQLNSLIGELPDIIKSKKKSI